MAMTSHAFPFDHSQLLRWLGAATLAKARPYVRFVSKLEWNDNVLRGMVQGSEATPYQTTVRFHQHATGQQHKLDIQGLCSCPVSVDCKHVGALLMASLEHSASVSTSVRPELISWLEHVRGRLTLTDGKKTKSKKASLALAYVLAPSRYARHHEVLFFKAGVVSDGSIRSISTPWNNVESALLNPPQFIAEEDLGILRMLWMGRSRANYGGGFALSGINGAAVLEKMLATGRLFAQDTDGKITIVALHAGASRAGRIDWDPCPGDRLRPQLQTVPFATSVIEVEPFAYLDQATHEVGLVELSCPANQMVEFLGMPPIAPAEAPVVAAVLRQIAPTVPVPPVELMSAIRVVDSEPVPVLALDTLPVYALHNKFYDDKLKQFDHATVLFDYDGLLFEVGTTDSLMKTPDGEIVQVKRHSLAEKSRLAELRQSGLNPVPPGCVYGPQTFPASLWGFNETDAWTDFMQHNLPGLRAQGWQVHTSPNFRFNIIEIDSIEGQMHEAADGWFDLDMGIRVGDRIVRLEPLLAELFQRDQRWLKTGLESIADDEAIELKTDRGERLRLRADRIKPVVRVLIDLFDGATPGASLRVSRLDAGRLDALNDTGRWQFHGDDSIRQLAQRLKSGAGISEVPVPKSLQADLRSYQQQGLSWMQFLREHKLSGVLADDMGLGKTIQTLAHLLVEQEAGRLDRPALIVVPTSLVHNWQDEARRFAPSLRVLSLQGAGRKDQFDQIGNHDLVLTTYALLWRDHEILAQHNYHLLILDEAQFVKNASTKAAVAIRDLKARHRLCLTGTPLENHLGELWSMFDFLLPGFLGNQKDFTKRWRTPIEKAGDTVRRDLLARRIRPFMLRRRKNEVATELPPKTLIVRRVDLDGTQRDLYETVRTAMHEKVRAVIAEQGLARSHIVVLDALLKLRQVCCDPRLVKLKKAEGVKESAKLELLLSMLPDMIEEGRRVLLFSQFTGMLALIATEVEKAGIPYVLLTGDTTDRATPVRRFQDGEVPLFLISLKAGGVGLNLTAADTVIHYDPWWNPAAENQATDRAHRLGQEKPVFVYKLIIAGSIEEKIVALQDKKAALAEGILSEDGKAAVKFSGEDLEALFAPMPAVGK
ncbi:DEAD/DEAH box helicase [Actimicrobium antarcticum]|uniref:Helicase n=1 Tax=Actimicrobium antarcticum TaxID=1051899 RepID=A0ABP7TNI7_9BURK